MLPTSERIAFTQRSHLLLKSLKLTDNLTFNPVAPLVKFSSLSEADQRLTVTAEPPITLQQELSDSSTRQVSWHKDGTKVLQQSEVDLQSEGTHQGLVVPSAEQAHSSFYQCESKDDDIQFAVEVKGDFKLLRCTFLHGQLIIEQRVKNHVIGVLVHFP